jgi:hypothetical protein
VAPRDGRGRSTMEGAGQHCEDLHPHMKAAVYSRYGEHSRAASRKRPQSSYRGRVTGNPHLTRRWPFGRVTEGLPTIRELSLAARIEMPRATFTSSP